MADDDKQRRHDEQPRAYVREREEPTEKPTPIPRTFLIVAVLIVAWGLSYFYFRIGGITGAGDTRTPVVAKPGDAADGAGIFAASCASCHQASGQGLAGVLPPRDGSGRVQAG